jgi:hypothetical protein
MKLLSKLSLFAFILLLTACGNQNQESDNPYLIEANEFHQKSLDVREEILNMEDDLKKQADQNSEIIEALKIWDKDIMEVPGFEHGHDHEDDHGHHRKYHVHNPVQKMEPELHLQYQKMMYEEITAIFAEIEVLLKRSGLDT